jgi:hypothetical protein
MKEVQQIKPNVVEFPEQEAFLSEAELALLDLGPSPADFLASEPRNIVRLPVAGFTTYSTALGGGIPTHKAQGWIGPPGVGKTGLLSQMGVQAAQAGYRVTIVFKDEGRFAGCVRLGQQLGLSREKLEQNDEAEIVRFREALLDLCIHVPDPDDKKNSLERIIERVEATAGTHPAFLGIDVQNIFSELEDAKPNISIREGIEAKMVSMEKFANRGHIAITLSEGNRASYRHKDEKDNVRGIAAGAESRAIEYHTRVILNFSGNPEELVNVEFSKNSAGPGKPMFTLTFDPRSATFREIGFAEAEAQQDERKAKKEEAGRAKMREKIRKELKRRTEIGGTALRTNVGGNAQWFSDERDLLLETGEVTVHEQGRNKLYRLK